MGERDRTNRAQGGRELSFWGWGYADRFPNEATRKGLGAMMTAVLRGARFELAAIPKLGDIELPPPRMTVPDVLAAFSSSTTAVRASHTYGKAYRDLVRGLAGDFSSAPDFVAQPTTEAQVAAVLDWCADNRVACIPFGGGTSVVGGVECPRPSQAGGAGGGERSGGLRGAVSLDVRGLCAVLEVDRISRAARIQAGATGPMIARALAEHGLTLRHYPQSFEFSTLGGWIATRAGGHFATLYTHIDDFVESVRMLTGAGVYESRRLPGSGAGPSPDRMVIGSEGTLGVITEAWMRVHAQPRWRASASASFTDFHAAVQATRELAQSGLYPANCRLLDAREAMLHQVAPDRANVLLLGFESAHHPVDWPMAQALEVARAHGGVVGEPTISDADADDGSHRNHRSTSSESWRSAFLDAPYRFAAMVSIGAVIDTFETACTWDRFPALHDAVITAVRAAMKRECGAGFVSCRFTHVYPDGPAPYYTFIAPGAHAGRASDRARAHLEQWTAIRSAAAEAVLGAGGTITHHHAVGRVHKPWYQRQRPEPFALALAAAKRGLDPAGVLNPGALI